MEISETYCISDASMSFCLLKKRETEYYQQYAGKYVKISNTILFTRFFYYFRVIPFFLSTIYESPLFVLSRVIESFMQSMVLTMGKIFFSISSISILSHAISVEKISDKLIESLY